MVLALHGTMANSVAILLGGLASVDTEADTELEAVTAAEAEVVTSAAVKQVQYAFQSAEHTSTQFSSLAATTGTGTSPAGQ